MAPKPEGARAVVDDETGDVWALVGSDSVEVVEAGTG